MFSSEEMQRYSRHFTLQDVGIAGQEKLKNAKVLCIGAGGLGSPLLLYLAAAGVGTIGIVDDDHVELSNLQRQVLYTTDQKGKSKAAAAKEKLLALNPFITVNIHPVRITAENALELIGAYDIIADGTDNFPTRYLINDACFQLRKPNVFASIFQFDGQLSIFTAENGPCYRCLFPAAPPAGLIPNCSEAGVLGILPGIIGSLQAAEVIKLILNIGEPLIARLLVFNALNMQSQILKINKNPTCELCTYHTNFHDIKRPDYTCALSSSDDDEIEVAALKQLIDQHSDFILLDVREPYEYEICNLQGQLIPLAELPHQLSKLDKQKLYVVHCKSGGRSYKAVQLLKEHGFTRVKNLTGGILAWARTIDTSLIIY